MAVCLLWNFILPLFYSLTEYFPWNKIRAEFILFDVLPDTYFVISTFVNLTTIGFGHTLSL
jgi:uncharacterized membrane protein